MKQLYLLIVLALTTLAANAQIVNIPDINFKARLLAANTNNFIARNLSGNYFKIDANGDGNIQLSEAQQVSMLDVGSDGYPVSQKISNVQGVKSFTNIKYLYFHWNTVTGAVDVSDLIYLEQLGATQNQIQSLNMTGDTALTNIRLSSNQLSAINVTGFTNLSSLGLSFNQFSTINLSNLPNLFQLELQNNNLNTISFSNTPAIEILEVSNNNLTSLDVTGLQHLTYLRCNDNALTTVTNLNAPELLDFYCQNNFLTTIDVSSAVALYSVNCQNNQLTSLFVKNGKTEFVSIGGNPNLAYICADESQMVHIQDQVTQYGYNNCSYNSYCSFTPGGIIHTVTGSNTLDNNNDGCDTADALFPIVKFTVTNGSNSGSFIADSSGNYQLFLTEGTHTITPVLENPAYFTASPASVSVTFPDQASPLLQNFCITPNGVHHDLEVVIIPTTIARPGFAASYKIIYRNKGNYPQTGSINFTFEDNKMDVSSANPNPSNQSTNVLLWNYTDLQPLESREIALTFVINAPTATPAVNIGDQLNFGVAIDPMTNDEVLTDNTASLKQTVVGSMDPNDKVCTEGASITPNMVGEYVHYVIRFENTGTYAAENIVVKDMIDYWQFDINTLLPLSASHPFTSRITNNNQVEFIFENINLPFDNANNDGYIAFKIKTRPTLAVGNTFSNTASIYFDYNFPIVTNTYITTVQALGNQDFEFNSVFNLSPVPAKNILTITAKETVVMTSVNIYNVLGQLVQVNTNPNNNIDVSALQSGSYFIKIISNKGSATGKFVKE